MTTISMSSDARMKSSRCFIAMSPFGFKTASSCVIKNEIENQRAPASPKIQRTKQSVFFMPFFRLLHGGKNKCKRLYDFGALHLQAHCSLQSQSVLQPHSGKLQSEEQAPVIQA